MPKQKKQSANWYIAATHYLTAVFVPLFFGGIALMFVTRFIELNSSILPIVQATASALLVFLGVMYSSRYVNKTYIIRDPSSVVILSTIYMAVLSFGFTGYSILSFLSQNSDASISLPSIFLGFVSSLINIFIFYGASKKYIVA